MELLSTGASEDPNLGTEPGTSFLRQGQVYFLLGNYTTAAHLWQDAQFPGCGSITASAGTDDGPASYPR